MNLFGVPFWIWGLLCMGVAMVFVFVFPHRPAVGLRFFLQRWGHSLVWVFLAMACFLAPSNPELAKKIAGLGGLTYAAFMWSSFSP